MVYAEDNGSVPVVFVHKGEVPVYLIYSALQAARFDNKVYVITDAQITIPGVTVVNYRHFNFDEENFRRIYKHQSSNSFDFEFICIYRWFILKNFISSAKIKKVVYLDSDTSLFACAKDFIASYPDFKCAYNVAVSQPAYSDTGSACCSVWESRSLDDFCTLITDHYTTRKISGIEEKWEHHLANNLPGGICDMTFLYYFSKERGFFPLGKVHEGQSVDFNNMISTNYHEDEYETSTDGFPGLSSKKLRFSKGLPYGNNRIMRKPVRFIAVAEYSKLLFMFKSGQMRNARLFILSKLLHWYYRRICTIFKKIFHSN